MCDDEAHRSGQPIHKPDFGVIGIVVTVMGVFNMLLSTLEHRSGLDWVLQRHVMTTLLSQSFPLSAACIVSTLPTLLQTY